jgi:hypothetical protein
MDHRENYEIRGIKNWRRIFLEMKNREYSFRPKINDLFDFIYAY